MSIINTVPKRVLNLPLLTLYGLGTILGAGIYVLVGKVAGIAGIYTPAAFLLSALLAALTGCSFAEMSSRYPKSAGEVVYIQQAFHWSSLSRWVGLLVILTGLVSAATLVKGFAGYFIFFVPLPTVAVECVLVFLLAAIAAWGIAESVTVASVVTCIEVLGLLFLLFVLRENFALLPTQWNNLLPPPNVAVYHAISLGAFLAFYAFIGFEDMVNVAEETRNPERTLPRAIILALSLSAILYILISILAVLALPISVLANTDKPMIDLMATKSQWGAQVIGVISLIAVLNGALIQIIMGARVVYGMAMQGLLFPWLSALHSRTQTPIRATVCVALCVLLLATSFPLEGLATATSFIILVVFCLVNLSLIVIKSRKVSVLHTGFSNPIIVPYLALLLNLLMLALQLVKLLGKA